jgi:hypothetical protein
VTTPNPRTEPVRNRSLPSERDRLSATGRTSRWIASAALVVAILALGLAAWQLLAPAPSCQDEAWAVSPKESDLPSGWGTSATQYDLDRKTISFTGPIPQDEYTAQAAVITTITCFERNASEAVNLSQQAARDANQDVIVRKDLGEQSFSAVDDSGANFLQLRKGRVVVYLAGSAETSSTEVDQIASAFDKALGGDGGDIRTPEPAASGDLGNESLPPGESAAPESPAAPELVALLPTQVGDFAMLNESATGSTFLAEDQGSRAILAALRAAGKEPDDLHIANAYPDDPNGTSDLSVMAVSVKGLPVEQTRDLVLDVWLAATGPGVTQDTVQLAGKSFTRIDYGDEGIMDYVLLKGDVVIDIATADAALAEQAAAALP